MTKSEFEYFHQLLTRSDIFCLQETWLEDQDKVVDFPGYSHFRSERKNKEKSSKKFWGALVYYKTKLSNKIERTPSANGTSFGSNLMQQI